MARELLEGAIDKAEVPAQMQVELIHEVQCGRGIDIDVSLGSAATVKLRAGDGAAAVSSMASVGKSAFRTKVPASSSHGT